MKRLDFKDIKRLYTELIFPFYEVTRDMDLPLKGARRQENDAEHSWTVAFIACTLAPHLDPALDIGKLAQLGIVHDLVEVYAGDTTIWDENMVATKHQREAEAFEEIKQKFSMFPWLANAIKEYENKLSAESKFVWAIDKYIATTVRYLDVSAGSDYFKNTTPKTLSQFITDIEPTRQKAHAHDKVGEYYDEVLKKLISNKDWFSPETKN